MRPAGRETRVETHSELSHGKGRIIAKVSDPCFCCEVFIAKENGAPRRVGAQEMTMSGARASQCGQPNHFGDDTRAVVARPKWA